MANFIFFSKKLKIVIMYQNLGLRFVGRTVVMNPENFPDNLWVSAPVSNNWPDTGQAGISITLNISQPK